MLKIVVVYSIRIYQVMFSPLLVSIAGTHGCKFRPTCSEYTVNSIQEYGVMRGLQKGFKRFMKCR